MKSTDIRDIFYREYKGHKNLFTPESIAYEQSEKNESLLYELSKGSGILSKYMIGVTVLDISSPERRRHDLSRAFSGDDWSTVFHEASVYARELE
jgi:hypothetical protein